MPKAKIIGSGFYVPEKIVTNADLEKMVETTNEWIVSRSGIRERRVTDEKTLTSELAFRAAQNALKSAKVNVDYIELILVATTSPDSLFPSVACILQDKLGAKDIPAFDVSAACAGFNFALAAASAFIESGQYNNILVVGADTLTKHLDWTDRGTCVLFGDGAGAMVLSASNDNDGILASHLGAEGEGGKFLIMPTKGCITMEGKEVFKFAVRALEKSVIEVLNKAGLTLNDLDLLIPHQANIRIIDHVAKKFGLPSEKIFVNLDKYGNTSAASIPIAFNEAMSAGRIKKGDVVVLAGFGAGLTYGANVIRF
ncbi:3-oxoacyl-ACP synthase [candidate division WOR-1 bacterium RIFOXYA12_FULL_43_27]|nr:MAG: 3-oxoacyl-ACP synthase [candidate division WOR-1 bacterium RIFOXYA12_FULL_43_27]OGC18922.1 MAG: 3-oxoacyl-ACP synthase [candidate division WOR-1 bacterium RIFOXYB2_FULL_46_45]OGC29063.1 MAG: 3-oxoacyl-ACP synthase [candidate division WOR-1 bacterium RIFOXYA2_FULL_46_56]